MGKTASVLIELLWVRAKLRSYHNLLANPISTDTCTEDPSSARDLQIPLLLQLGHVRRCHEHFFGHLKLLAFLESSNGTTIFIRVLTNPNIALCPICGYMCRSRRIRWNDNLPILPAAGDAPVT